jgi:hypothetical protein
VNCVVIEDTAKVWPLGGVRLSLLVFPEHSGLGIPEASADLLMMAPPFSALVVEAFADDMAASGMAVIYERIASNRVDEFYGHRHANQPADADQSLPSTDPRVAASLDQDVANIGHAPNANAKAGMLQGFTLLVQAQTGKALTSDQAKVLITLAGALRTEGSLRLPGSRAASVRLRIFSFV